MIDITSKAYEEAQRLIEKYFSYDNPYTCIIDAEAIPFEMREKFYSQVEEELLLKGEKITRHGEFFKIDKYQKKKT